MTESFLRSEPYLDRFFLSCHVTHSIWRSGPYPNLFLNLRYPCTQDFMMIDPNIQLLAKFHVIIICNLVTRNDILSHMQFTLWRLNFLIYYLPVCLSACVRVCEWRVCGHVWLSRSLSFTSLIAFCCWWCIHPMWSRICFLRHHFSRKWNFLF